MPDESILLKAVLEKPDDDAPRLAYAEACKQSDPARAEYIRMQLTLARADPLSNDLDDVNLSRREADLWRENAARWSRVVVPPATACECHRGFIEHLTMPLSVFLETSSTLLSRAPIRHLTLSASKGKLQDLFSNPVLSSMRSLALNGAGLDDEAMRVISQSPFLGELRWLSLANNQIDFFGINLLAQAKNTPQLKWANFSGNKVNPGEQFSSDQGVIVESWLPPEGVRLEEMNGPLPWLHVKARSTMELVPDRFWL